MDKRRISIVFLIVLTNAMAATAILPMLPIYVEGQFGASPIQAMLVIAAYYISQFVAAPWLGKLSDRFGRRPILIISQLGTIVAYLLFIFAAPLGDTIGPLFGMSGGLIIMYLARLLDGITDGNVSVAEAYASDISDEKSRAHALGLIGGANGLGHIIGPALAFALSGISLTAPMVGAVAMGIVTVLLTIILLDETLTQEKRSTKRAAADLSVIRLVGSRPIALVLATAFIIGLYIATLFTSFSLYAERVLFPDASPETVAQNVNLMIMVLGLASASSQIFLVGRLIGWLGEQRLVVIGGVLLFGSALAMSSGVLTLVVVALLAYALGFGVSWPSLQSIMTRLGSEETVGKRLGLFQSAFSLAFIFAPLIAGLLLETFGPHAIFYNGALLSLLATALGFIILHLPMSDQAVKPVEATPEPQGFFQRFHH